MKFDIKKVVSPTTENKEQFLGRQGFFADTVNILKSIVSSDDGRFEGNTSTLFKIFDAEQTEMVFKAKNGAAYRYFYPLEEERVAIVPFDTVQELKEWFVNHFGGDASKCDTPLIWVTSRDSGLQHLVSGYYSKDETNYEDDGVVIDGNRISLDDLCENYVLLDKTRIGKEYVR